MATRDDVARAITALRAATPKQTITGKQFGEMVSVWSEILEDVPAELLMQAVKVWISGDTPWLPSVGQLRKVALDMLQESHISKTAGEAWEEVRLAMSRGEYAYRKGYYEWSSHLVERAFNALGGWHYFNAALMDSVMADRAHFMRAYSELLERDEKERREAPAVAAFRRMLLGDGMGQDRSKRPAGDGGMQGGRVDLLGGGGSEATPAATGRGQTSEVFFSTSEVKEEFSNPHPALPQAEKGAQYCEYYGSLPAYVGAAFSFVVSASAPAFAGETWREEDGQLSPIPAIVGAR